MFQRAYKVSLEVHRASLEFPKVEQYGLAEQMRRSSKSVCANIAEGFGRQSQSKAEFQRVLRMSVGSADEMRVWTRYCLDLGYIDAEMWANRNQRSGIRNQKASCSLMPDPCRLIPVT